MPALRAWGVHWVAEPRESIRILCPAKVNLHLRVLGRRSDGYHDILTLMQPVGLWDELELQLAGSGITLSCSEPGVPNDQGNLAYRAALRFQKRVGEPKGVQIRLRKRIPVGAGLGGGSSDAAGVLKGLNELMGAPLDQEELRVMAAELGADVPFFLHGGPAIATGIGERLEPVRLRVFLYYVLWFPGWSVSTGWAYRNLDLGLTTPPKKTKIPQLIEGFEDVIALLHNDLETVTARHHPWIQKAKERLRNAGAEGVLMSGSGPTVFGLFRQEEEARLSLEKLSRAKGEFLCWSRGEPGSGGDAQAR